MAREVGGRNMFLIVGYRHGIGHGVRDYALGIMWCGKILGMGCRDGVSSTHIYLSNPRLRPPIIIYQ